MSTHLSLPAVLRRILRALKNKEAFSLVRIGDGENIVISQNSVWPLKKVMREPWAKRKDKGVTLPNLRLRDELVRSVRKATVVGILDKNDRMIRAPRYLKRRLTDRVFRHYKLNPRLTCNAIVNRVMPYEPLFRKVVKGRRILVVNRNPSAIKSVLERPPYRAKVTAMIRFAHYRQIRSALRKAARHQRSFDLALITCGVNAVILAPRIARLTGKVAIDFGQAPKFVKRK
ncbi:GT-D fold domain-containing glycosyltransferase [Cohnella panacarvi]|uniref:GT-D fold domain-containing glycosyltransferase n=1 Tax=Cohnella panacarvi TaxID=400776 RepID=UPI00047E7347|nr:GT-D fold domain-containing glycosyltransferase [Cohnella panacarvi]